MFLQNINSYLCTEVFLYVCYSFLLISNRFCDISLLLWPHCTGRNRDVGGDGQHWALEAHVHKTTYGLLAPYLMLLITYWAV
jgi:hypothetical protein